MEKEQNENYVFLQETESNNLSAIQSSSNTKETPSSHPLSPLNLYK